MRRLALPALITVLACGAGSSGAPVLAAVSPDDAARVFGASLTITGLGLDGVTSAALVGPGGRVELQSVRAVDATRVTAGLAPGAPEGLYDLEVADADGATTRLPLAFRVVDGELRIEVADVGQGDGAYVQAPNGRTLVIDGGRARHKGDSIVPTLLARAIPRPEMALVSHFDADHLGGIVELLRGPDGLECTSDDRVPPLGLFDYAPAQSTCNSDLCVSYYKLRACNAGQIAGGDGSRVPVPGEELRLGGSVRVRVLAVNGELGDGVVVPTGSDNSNSIALVVEFGNFRYFTAGDLTGGLGGDCPSVMDSADVESALGPRVGRVDVLHVNHHGSCTSSNAAFLRALAPQAAVVSVGENNAYGHPHQEVLDRVAQGATAVFMTSPGITTSNGSFPRTRPPANLEPRSGSVRIRTLDGAAFTVEVLDAVGVPVSSRSFAVR
jgi:beta-lactamase superfamily II metal-dependent hydrolase